MADSTFKMTQGRGSATRIVVLGGAILYLASRFDLASAATYFVRGSRGWTFNVSEWPKGKHFGSSNVLVFKYNRTYHNVVVVDRGGYDDCRTSWGVRVYRSGEDRIRLHKGMNFFICSIPRHCEAGMNIAINAGH